MGKAGKRRRSDVKKAKKRTLKEARRALYRRFADEGRNQKSKRNSLKTKRVQTIAGLDHPDGACGNIACTKCFERSYKGFLRDGQPHNMPHKVWVHWNVFSREEKMHKGR